MCIFQPEGWMSVCAVCLRWSKTVIINAFFITTKLSFRLGVVKYIFINIVPIQTTWFRKMRNQKTEKGLLILPIKYYLYSSNFWTIKKNIEVLFLRQRRWRRRQRRILLFGQRVVKWIPVYDIKLKFQFVILLERRSERERDGVVYFVQRVWVHGLLSDDDIGKWKILKCRSNRMNWFITYKWNFLCTNLY